MSMRLSTEAKVGLFFLATLVALGVMTELVEDWSLFSRQASYRAYFDSIVGLNPGDPVRMAGVDVGKVKSIRIENGQVRIDFAVDADTRMQIDTMAEIRRTNLLGGLYLGLDFGRPDSPLLPPGGAVPTRSTPSIDEAIANFNRNQERVLGQLGNIIEKNQQPLAEGLSRLESILSKIDQGQGTLGKLVNDPALYGELSTSVNRFGALVERIDQGQGTLGKLARDDTLYRNLSATAGSLKSITASIDRGEGSLGKLLRDDGLYLQAVTALKQVGQVAAKANRGEGSLGKLVNDDGLYLETSKAMTHLRSIAEKIDQGGGTLGKLINDDQLYTDTNRTLKKVEKAVDGMSDSGPISALGVVTGTLF